jgi:steroid delta-isomerase-like uncharacterized protein
MLRFSMPLLFAFVCSMPCLADEAENVQVAIDMVEAINDRELDRLDQLVAPDIVRQSAATAGVVVTSLEQFKAFLRSDFAGVPDSVISIDIVFGNDEYVAMRAIYSGTQTGQVGPFPPSGKRVELPFMGILRIDEGRIAEMWVEWDNVFMLTQLGHFSPNGGESE